MSRMINRLIAEIVEDDMVVVKKMKKSEMLYKNQVGHVKAEREILIKAKNPWVVDLKCSF